MNSQNFSEVDDAGIQRFERDWINGNPGEFESYLPLPTDSRFVGTLEELVHVDLEFRWKEYQQQPSSGNVPPKIEAYLQRHPELEAVKLSLIQGEFELSHRVGDRPAIQHYVDRFGEKVGDQPLRPILQAIVAELKRSQVVKPGATLDRYEIMNEHGRGGFGAVWRATDTKLGRRIAVKQLGQRLAKDGESRRRFISEARVTAKLEHPGIVPVYDISNDQDDHAYYTMRLIQGRTMAQAIDHLHGLDPKSSEYELLRQRLLESFVDACQTIQYAHSQGVIHRDIKPQNMIVGNYGETIILDWGLASVIEVNPDPTQSILLNSDPEILSKEESLKSLSGNIMGTPAYMPAEQARGQFEAITRRSDIYSLGATLYHLITGIVPFTDGPIDELLDRVKTGDISAAHLANPGVEMQLSAITAKAMQLEQKNRYDSVGDLLTDIQKFLSDQPVSAYRDPPLARISRWIRKNQTTAALLALAVLFGFVAMVAGIMIKNAWNAREERRITDLQIAAERADATALSQIQSGRFDSAANTLEQATELVADEPRLKTLSQQLAARRDRTQKIVDFYRYSTQAQEETFFDRVDRASTYGQAALDRLGVFSDPDWWSRLPDGDLTPLQKNQLITEVYRNLGMLASTRLAETSKSVVGIEMVVNPKKLDPADPMAILFQASSLAAEQANRFRNSRAMQIMHDISEFAQGNRNGIDLTNLTPKNSTDSAIMGSILDNNVPREGPVRAAMSAFLGFQDPNEVAQRWLDDAVKDSPDWFWLPVFMGLNLNYTGHPEAAIKILSHAIGIRPNYWVGYQYRAWASVVASQKVGLSRNQKTALLNSASRDIQRALDLEKSKSDLYWVQAMVLSQSGAAPGQISQSFFKALSLHPRLGDLNEGHYSAISQMFYGLVQSFVAQQKEAENLTSELYFLEAAGLLWQGQHEQALKTCNQGLQRFANDPDLISMRQFVQLDQGTRGTGQVISYDPSHVFAMQFALANAALYRDQGLPEKEYAQLIAAVSVARSDWQRSAINLRLARNLVEAQRESEAIPLINQAIEIDRALDLSDLIRAARLHSADQAIKICESFQNSIKPKIRLSNDTIAIQQPALMNGSFELGLSYYWPPYAQRIQSSTWNNFGTSRTVVDSESGNAKSGKQCLSIRVDSPVDDRSYGMMTQSLPVTNGQAYKISFWARADDLSDNAIKVGIIKAKDNDDSSFFSLEAGTYDWKPFTVTVIATEDVLPLSIWAQGSGRAMLDDFRIAAATSQQ